MLVCLIKLLTVLSLKKRYAFSQTTHHFPIIDCFGDDYIQAQRQLTFMPKVMLTV
jgi:hypothetical protein